MTLSGKRALLLVPAVVTWAVVSRSDIGMSPDSLFYWSAARTIAEQGMIATQVSPRDYARTVGEGRAPDPGVAGPGGATVYPLTTWPAGYPLALAALTPVAGGSTIAAARILAAMTLLLLMAAFVMVGSQLVDPPRAACAAALVACLPLVHTSVRMMWSDGLFAALALAALALLAWAFSPVGRPGLALALAGVALGAATYVRYTGVLVAAGAVVAGTVVALRIRPRPAMALQAAVAIAIYAILVAPLFARNFSLAGDLSGAEHAPAAESGLWLVSALITAFVRGVVPWVGQAVPGPRDALVTTGVSLAAWAAAGAAVWMVVRSSVPPPPRPDAPMVRRPMGVILLLFAVLYSAALLGLRTRWHFDFNTRMLLPAVASLVMLVVCGLEERIADAQVWRVHRVALVAVPLVTIASLAAADHFIAWRGYNSAAAREHPVAQWVRNEVAHAAPGAHLRFASVGYFIPYLNFVTGNAGASGLPDIPEPQALLPRPPYTATVVILEPGGRRFACPAYQVAYEAVLDVAADSTILNDGFSAWWLSGTSAEKLAKRAGTFAPSCH